LNRFLLLILLAISCTANAEPTRYITDQLEITLRSGQSTKHQIVRMLPSGTTVEVLEAGEEGKYTRVRTEQGTEGWVLTRYLDEQASARQRLKNTNTRLNRLKDENKRLKSELSKTRTDKHSLDKDKNALTNQSNKLQQELNRIKRVSADVLSVDKENQSLNAQLQQIQTQYDQAQQQISSLQDSTARDWFLVGGAVILLGILIGLIIPKIHWKKKSEWGSL